MKRFNDYIIDAQINESFAATKYYPSEINAIFAEYEKAKKAYAAKEGKVKELNDKKDSRENDIYKAMRALSRAENPAVKLAKYPMAILVDKAGFTPKTIMKELTGRNYGKTKEVNDDVLYGTFILSSLEEGKFTKQDLIDWWKEYDEAIGKKNWTDPKWVIANLDPTRMWNPWNPNDTYTIDGIIKEPFRILNHVKNTSKNISYGHLSYKESQELKEFYSDPANQEALSKAFKAARKKIEAVRPTYNSASLEVIKNLLETGVKVDGKDYDVKKACGKGDSRARYSGDVEDERADAIKSLVLKAIMEYYGVGYSVWYSKSDEDYYGDNIKTSVSAQNKDRKPTTDEDVKQFVDDGNMGIRIEIKDLGPSKKSSDTSGVHASSFSTYYYHDFDLKMTVWQGADKDDEEVFSKKYEQVCVASSYFSGGWN